MSKPWQIKSTSDRCIHNGGVECSEASASCITCGWNPEVREERVRKWQKKNGHKDFSTLIARIRRLNTR